MCFIKYYTDVVLNVLKTRTRISLHFTDVRGLSVGIHVLLTNLSSIINNVWVIDIPHKWK